MDHSLLLAEARGVTGVEEGGEEVPAGVQVTWTRGRGKEVIFRMYLWRSGLVSYPCHRKLPQT